MKKLEMTTDGVKDKNIYKLSEEFNDEERLTKYYNTISFYRKKSLVKVTKKADIRK